MTDITYILWDVKLKEDMNLIHSCILSNPPVRSSELSNGCKGLIFDHKGSKWWVQCPFVLFLSCLDHKPSFVVINVPKMSKNPSNLPYKKFFDFDARYFELRERQQIFSFWLWKIHSRTIDFRLKFKNCRMATLKFLPV